jgi:hypothetical protein
VRNTKGMPVAPDKDLKVTGQKAIESEEVAGKREDPAAHLANCEDCMKHVTSHSGLAHKADGMKSEDQGGKAGNPAKGHDTERRRH